MKKGKVQKKKGNASQAKIIECLLYTRHQAMCFHKCYLFYSFQQQFDIIIIAPFYSYGHLDLAKLSNLGKGW